MSLTKFEKLIYVGCPWLFGIVTIISGIIVTRANPERLHGMLLICSGLICMSLFCICALLTKIITSRKT